MKVISLIKSPFALYFHFYFYLFIFLILPPCSTSFPGLFPSQFKREKPWERGCALLTYLSLVHDGLQEFAWEMLLVLSRFPVFLLHFRPRRVKISPFCSSHLSPPEKRRENGEAKVGILPLTVDGFGTIHPVKFAARE